MNGIMGRAHGKRIKMSKKQYISFLLLNLLVLSMVSWLFYDSIWGLLLLLPLLWLLFYLERGWLQRRKEKRVRMEFKELLSAVMTAMHTGYALEQAIVSATSDLKLLYPEGFLLEGELLAMQREMACNVPVETLFYQFAEHMELEEIMHFAEIVQVAKRSGGNLVRIMEKTVQSISIRMTVEEEITTMITAKKLEQSIMGIMPTGMLFYLHLTNGSYLSPLYHNIVGIVIMTICLIGNVLAIWWGNRLMKISV